MELSYLILKQFISVFLLCYGVTAVAKCSKQPTIDKNKKLVIHDLPERYIKSNISLEYNAKGLEPLFDLANSFMDTVQPKKFGEVFQGKDRDFDKFSDWKWVLEKYEIPIAICIGVGLLFAIFMPIVGFCFCCCRCCGKCGGDMKQSEKRASQHCKVAFTVFISFIFVIMMLCGTLFMFVTNTRISEGYDGIATTYKEAVEEAVKMADYAGQDVFDLTNDQALCVTDKLREGIGEKSLNESIGIPLRTKVKTNVSSVLTKAIDTSNTIDATVTNLEDIKTKDVAFQANINTFKDNVNDVTSKLNDAVTECEKDSPGSATCENLKKIKIEIKMDFDNIPDIKKHLQSMKVVQDLKLSDSIKKAQKLIDDIPKTVLDKSKDKLDSVKTMLNDADAQIQKAGNDVYGKIKNTTDEYKKEAFKQEIYGQVIDSQDNNRYERIRYKVYIGLSALMAFIVFLLLVGLLCGSCGYHKEYMPTERTATSNCGGIMLMAAVGLMFIFSFILMIFCVLWFTVGIHVHLSCREMKDGELIDVVLDGIPSVNINVSVTEVLKNCRQNVALYQATPFFEEQYNVTEKIKFDKMKEIKKKMEDELKFDISDTKVLSDETKKALNDLVNSNIFTIDFNKFFQILNDDLTKTDLTKVVNDLETISTQLTAQGKTAIAGKVDLVVTGTKDMQSGVIVKLKSDILEIEYVPGYINLRNLKPNYFKVGLKSSAQDLKTKISPLQDDGKAILKDLEGSQTFIQKDAKDFIIEKVKELATKLLGYAEDGINHIINQVRFNAARCKPVANLYDGVINTFMCKNLVENINGFWLGLGWCLLFFIPVIICSVKLAKYFRRMEYTAGMDTIVVDHPPYNDKHPSSSKKSPYSTPSYSHDIRPPPPYTSVTHNNPGYQHV